MKNKIIDFYEIAFTHFGDLKWWPADNPFEISIGAILTQNTNWVNAQKAIDCLRANGILDLDALIKTPVENIATSIKSSGYFNQKALKLKYFVEWFKNDFDGFFPNAENVSTLDLRKQLLSIKGIGPETADDILLYAFERPVFVVDAYTYRIAVRHGWTPPQANYDELAELFYSHIEEDLFVYKNFHAILVELGKNYCSKKKPKCNTCPMKKTLVENNPYELY
ncbi:endonuclease III domain-containing protein [bacterium]|nr:endonuclease III domain-containing protein [bacterium]